MNFMKCVATLGLTVALVACGGGGGSAGTPVGSTPEPSDPITPTTPVTAVVVSDIVFELSKTSIVNTGSDESVLTVTVLDTNRNAITGVPVAVSLSPDGLFLKTSGDVTDDKGQYVGKILIGGNKANRIINATITSGDFNRVASVEVTGSQITITPVPASPSPGQNITLNLATLDSVGSPIQNAELTLSGTAGASGIIKTDISGNAILVFAAPIAAGDYTVVATGLGTSVTKFVSVVPVGSSGKPVFVGPISSASITPVPSLINTNPDGLTTNRSKLQARFLTTGNTGIEFMRVRFEIVLPALGGDEAISTGDSVVYSNNSGLAEADYIAGTRSSPTNGVTVRACYSLTDFASPTACPNQVTANLTVVGPPLSITIGDNNELQKGLGNIAYIKKFLIQVNDAAGVAVKDAIVSGSVDITHYGKGQSWGLPYTNVAVPSVIDIHSDYTPTPMPNGATGTLQSSSDAPTSLENIWCLNEDWNRNGSLDSSAGADEDVNGDGSIQPKKAEIIVSYVNGNRTDANGQLLLQVSYSQNMGRWLAYTLRATTGVAGSEGDAAKSYVTDVLAADVDNGSFLTPPFGAGSCRARN